MVLPALVCISSRKIGSLRREHAEDCSNSTKFLQYFMNCPGFNITVFQVFHNDSPSQISPSLYEELTAQAEISLEKRIEEDFEVGTNPSLYIGG